jgi:hypothetical protein
MDLRWESVSLPYMVVCAIAHDQWNSNTTIILKSHKMGTSLGEYRDLGWAPSFDFRHLLTCVALYAMPTWITFVQRGSLTNQALGTDFFAGLFVFLAVD